ncbi:DUF551 domain-containing protein [Enterobacter kobei]
MSTITRELAKLFRKITNSEIDAEGNAHVVLSPADSLLINNARIALASLEAEPVAWAHRLINKRNGVVHPWVYGSTEACPSEGDIFNIEVMPLYTAPPAPVSVPDEATPDNIDILASTYAPRGVTFQWDRDECNAAADSWNACRDAMLQGADRPQNEPQNIPENIPATQFKPVADLYGLTSPTGGETSFTFDAVEARDFIDGGWSCQDYVELERFQEAMLQNGNSPAQSDCCPEQNYIAPAQDGDSPVIPDGWVACSEQMPEDEQEVIVQNKMGYRYVSYFDEHSGLFFDMRGGNQMNCIEHIFVTHWMPLPAAPQQEA